MERVLRLWSVSRLRSFLCLLVAFSILFLNTCLESNAADTTTTTYSFTYNNTESRIISGNTYLNDSYLFDPELDSMDEVWTVEENKFWYLGTMASIFTTSSQCYGYRVVMERTAKTAITYSNCSKSRWILGTVNDLLSGANAGNYDDVEAERIAFWVPTNYAQVQIRLAPLFRFTTHETGASLGSYNINASYKLTITGYKTTAEYLSAMNGIQQELESQTQEMQQQTEEMQQQTEEMKEQTNTQKGMLSKITEFFNGFFDNLVQFVVRIFVPDTETMSGMFDSFMQFFNDRFGFLFYPFECMIDLVSMFLDSDNNDTTIVFPSFSISGFTIWEEYRFDLTQYDVIVDVFGYVRLVTGSMIAFGFIDYLRRFYDKRFGGGGT